MGMNLQIQQTLSYMEKEVHKESLLLKERGLQFLYISFSLREKQFDRIVLWEENTVSGIKMVDRMVWCSWKQ